MFHIQIDSEEGFVYLGRFSIVWANSVDPFFADERMEGFCSFNFDQFSIEFGAIDHEKPGLYFTTYKDGDIESTRPIFQLG